MADINYVIGDNKSLRILNIEGAQNLIKTTWEELKALRDDSNLMIGAFYRITDYDCILNPSSSWVISAHNVYDVIILATSDHTLTEEALAIRREGDVYFANANLEAWSLKYCLDNNQTRFPWAGSDEDGGKGVVYYLKDEYGNECDYDFKNVKCKRYEITATTLSDDIITYSRAFTSFTSKSGWTIDTANPYYFYTFTWAPNSTLNAEDVFDLSVMDLSVNSKIIFKNNRLLADDNTAELKPSCMIITKLASESVLTLEQFSLQIIENRTDFSCYNNTYNCKYNDFLVATIYNTFLFGCYFNTFGPRFNNNSFADSVYSNVFGADCMRNSLGSWCYLNTFSAYGECNTIEKFVHSNDFGRGLAGCHIGSYCHYNTFLGYCYFCNFEAHCCYNTIAMLSCHITLEQGCNYNIIGGENTLTTNRYYAYIYFHEGVECFELSASSFPSEISKGDKRYRWSLGMQMSYTNLQNIEIHSSTGTYYYSSSGLVKYYATLSLPRGLLYKTNVFVNSSGSLTYNTVGY